MLKQVNNGNVAMQIAQIIAQRGQDKVFLFPGGTIAPLMEGLDAHGSQLICTRHEQGAGYAALAVAKLTGKAQAVLVSSGPGVTNIVTPIADAYYDSVPLVIFTGQVGVKDMRRSQKHRQAGFQEVDTARMLAPITKQIFIVKTPEDALMMTRIAFDIAQNGRPGPVVVDLPMSTQLAELTRPKILPDLAAPALPEAHLQAIDQFVDSYLDALKTSKKPLLLVGNGVRLAKAQKKLAVFAKRTAMPYTQSLPALGTLPSKVGLMSASLGFHGHTGMQAAGLAMQQADLCLVLGSRLDVRQTGTEIEQFMPEAKLFRVELDPAEIKYRRIKKGAILNADMNHVLDKLIDRLARDSLPNLQSWNAELTQLKRQHPLPMGRDGALTVQRIVAAVDEATKGAPVTVTTGVGSHQQWAARHFSYDAPNRNWLTSAGLGAMGFDLPASIGAAMANPDHTILCFVGDGSVQMNIQELATIAELNLPIKIFCMDNRRFGIVSQFQKTKWDQDLACNDKQNPDFAALAAAYGIKGIRLDHLADMGGVIADALKDQSPCFIHCSVDQAEDISPMLLAGETLDKMSKA
ncbi:MAG: thiamine pyrophosphate-binding protein [Alphaproteobacteria bacterium]